MGTLGKIKRAIRGEVKLSVAALEALRRTRVSLQQRLESKDPDPLNLCSQTVRKANFFPGLTRHAPPIPELPREWNRDPRSGYLWPLEHHRDLKPMRSDGSDVRIVWELNRLSHLITLAHAYQHTRDEKLVDQFLTQLRSWNEQNPYGRGPNWTCAMEVALRAINLLAAFEIFRQSPGFDPKPLLHLFQQHGNYIRRNLEFSYIATSNHYLSDVAGLLWLGVMLPELRDADSWRDFGLRELLREMDKQVLPDGADFESSTGYHRFVTELFLYSFLLCRLNDIEIEKKYWDKLHSMLLYIRGYLRPDGFAPLIGDTDGGQFLQIRKRRGDDHSYLLAIGAVIFNDPLLKITDADELSWILGQTGVSTFESMRSESAVSQAFPHAGTYVMRHEDLYLCLNTSGAGINGRGSHGHNDALSIEVAAGGSAFIVDPGTYIYTGDLDKRHDFRSTAYHSTVKIDGVEQNTTQRDAPFVIGDEARPRVLHWDGDRIVAEHYGYRRLKHPVTHRRAINFDKPNRSWLIEDDFIGDADHDFEVWFHFAPGLDVNTDKNEIKIRDPHTNLTLTLRSLSLANSPALEHQFTSRDYGELEPSLSACWRISGRPGKLSWKLNL
ncbi:MAG TPA: alginate lyase family protein [Pyrinomonadaceae bacterium]|nr:alginate lyase family protein [Pyrinomonadaceae bacterium]